MHDLAKTLIMAQAIGGDTPAPTPTVTKGLVFSDYDSDGYPHKAEIKGNWTELPAYFMQNYGSRTTIALGKLETLNMSGAITLIRGNAFESNTFKSVIFSSSTTQINDNVFRSNAQLTSITFPATITTFGKQICYSCSELKTVTFEGSPTAITQNMFYSCSKVTTYDFSNCSAVPSLYDTASLGHKSGCVIKVPQSLLSTWQTATNWSGLTNVVWQGV